MNGALRHLSRWVWGVLFAALSMQWLIAARLDLSFDEAYYWTWAKHLQLSYYDHPPLVAWLIALSTSILGDSELAVRFFAPLCIFSSSLMLAATAQAFGGDRRAIIMAALLPAATIAGYAAGVIITPDTPLLLCSALLLFALAKRIETQNPDWWLGAGAACGLALLAKYTAIVLPVGILIWLLIVPHRRTEFLRWQLWAGGLIALAIFSPVLIWNFQHDWASFYKQGSRTLADAQFSFKTFAEFTGSQFGLLTPLLAIVFGLAIVGHFKKALQRNEISQLLCTLTLPFLIYLTLYSLGVKTEANWTFVLFPALAIMTSLHVSEHWVRLRSFTKASYALGFTLCALLVAYVLIPFDHNLGRRDLTQRLSGQANYARQVGQIFQAKKACMITTQDYSINATLSYYLRDIAPVAQLGDQARYNGWKNIKTVDDCMNKTVLAVVSERNSSTSLFSQYLGRMKLEASQPRVHHGTVVENYKIYSATSAAGP